MKNKNCEDLDDDSSYIASSDDVDSFDGTDSSDDDDSFEMLDYFFNTRVSCNTFYREIISLSAKEYTIHKTCDTEYSTKLMKYKKYKPTIQVKYKPMKKKNLKYFQNICEEENRTKKNISYVDTYDQPTTDIEYRQMENNEVDYTCKLFDYAFITNKINSLICSISNR